MISTTASSTDQSSSTPEFERNLDRLAEVAVHTGLGLAPGQELVMTATLDAIPLARRITEHAYKAGASLVTTLFTDEASTPSGACTRGSTALRSDATRAASGGAATTNTTELEPWPSRP